MYSCLPTHHTRATKSPSHLKAHFPKVFVQGPEWWTREVLLESQTPNAGHTCSVAKSRERKGASEAVN